MVLDAETLGWCVRSSVAQSAIIRSCSSSDLHWARWPVFFAIVVIRIAPFVRAVRSFGNPSQSEPGRDVFPVLLPAPHGSETTSQTHNRNIWHWIVSYPELVFDCAT